MIPGRCRRSDGELHALSAQADSTGTLYYELRMFLRTGMMLEGKLGDRSVFGNILLESFVVHLRNWIEFFYPNKERDDMLLAEDFFEGERHWSRNRGKMPGPLKGAYERASVLLSHMSALRPTTPREWDAFEIMWSVMVLFDRFHALGPRVSLRPILDGFEPMQIAITLDYRGTRIERTASA